MKSSLITICAAIVSLNCGVALSASRTAAPPALIRIARDDLCVTNGVVSTLSDGRLQIDTPSARAVVQTITAQVAEIRFRYLGPSKGSKPLASGEMRRQIGLKLKAHDTCNLVYATWHIEPDSKIAVSIKRNPGKQTHEECHANGYINIKPTLNVDVRKVLPGEFHSLRAELIEDELQVKADGRLVWDVALGEQVARLDGPVGLRTDNARFTFEYFASAIQPDAANESGSPKFRCARGPGD